MAGTKPYNPLEVQRAAALKAWRAAIRLKYSLAADREIAETMPQIEEQLDAALLSGESLALEPAAALMVTVE